MLTPRLNNCVECTTVPSLLSDIDCKLKDMGKALYNNTIFAFGYCIQDDVWGDLINYKRILTYKLCNPDYALDYDIAKIASKVKLLIHK